MKIGSFCQLCFFLRKADNFFNYFNSEQEQHENPQAVINSLRLFTKSFKKKPADNVKMMKVATTIDESEDELDSEDDASRSSKCDMSDPATKPPLAHSISSNSEGGDVFATVPPVNDGLVTPKQTEEKKKPPAPAPVSYVACIKYGFNCESHQYVCTCIVKNSIRSTDLSSLMKVLLNTYLS